MGLRKTVIGSYPADTIEQRLVALRALPESSDYTFSDKPHLDKVMIVIESNVDLTPTILGNLRQVARSA